MKDIIQQIMNQENLDEIYGYAQNALFKDGPVSITTLEILSYLKLFAPDYFSAVEEEILSIMGIFYKKPTARTLQSKSSSALSKKYLSAILNLTASMILLLDLFCNICVIQPKALLSHHAAIRQRQLI